MKKLGMLLGAAALLAACKQPAQQANKNFDQVLSNYYEDRIKLFPLEATFVGDARYNDLLPNDGSQQFINQAKAFYTKYLNELHQFKREDLSEQEQLSYDVLNYQAGVQLDAYKYNFEYLPFNQMFALPLTMGQLGAGTGAQPFKPLRIMITG